MNNNKYYKLWNENKNLLSLIPALVFLFVSMAFFIVGLKFDTPVIIFGYEVSTLIAVSLSISNTVIQIIGNEREPEGMGMALYLGWIASYVLGIGTNIYGILSIVSMNNVWLEYLVAVALGVMIEVLPEKLFVQFLNGISEKSKNNNQNQKQSHQNQQSYNPFVPPQALQNNTVSKKYIPKHKPNHSGNNNKPTYFPVPVEKRNPFE